MSTEQEHPGHDLVTIEMNGQPHRIHRGHQTVTQIKAACGVDASWVIEEIEAGGKLVLLADDAAITIKGNERFISHVRGGGSS